MADPKTNAGLTREAILSAFSRLDGKLRAEGVIGEICIFGGTAMVLAFNARLSTRDVDAVFQPPEVLRRCAKAVSEEMKLPETWLNDGVKGYVSGAPELTGEGLPQFENLRLIRPTAEYLFAMKCMASRVPSYSTKGDVGDIAFLMNHLGIKDAETAFGIIEKFYPPDRILPKTHFLIQEVLEDCEQARSGQFKPPK